MAYAPLLAKQKYLGSMVVLWPEIHTVSSSEIDFLLALANHTANAIQNAILYAEAQGKWELRLLLEASRLFSSSLDTQDILNKMAKMATEAVRADLTVVFVLDRLKRRSHRIVHYARNKKATDAIQHVLKALSTESEDTDLKIFGPNFSKGKPLLFAKGTDLPDGLHSLVGIIESGLVVPLRYKRSLLGAFVLASLSQHTFAEDSLSLITGLADLASIAIENAQLYEYERNIAETFQRSFLPSQLPDIPGYETAAYYRSAMAEAEVGGDFYDVFVTNEGNVGIVIGDVSGKGLKAAVTTAMGKYMIRAYVVENSSPSSVLTRFNRAFYENVPEFSFMTAFYGILNPQSNTFTYTSAGHDPPLLYSSETGQVTQISTYGLCLGIDADEKYVEKQVQLQPGDALFLYTDGATDVKGDSDRLRIERLTDLFLSHVHETAEQITADVSSGIWRYSRGKLPDDVVIVVLKRQDKTISPQ
jgi:GAF domain-containing protein